MTKEKEIKRDLLLSKIFQHFGNDSAGKQVFEHYIISTLPKIPQKDFEHMKNNLNGIKGKNENIAKETMYDLQKLRAIHDSDSNISDSTEQILLQHMKVNILGDNSSGGSSVGE
jgi:hypothetical protein